MSMTTPPQHIVLYADDDPDDITLVQEALRNYSSHIKVITRPDGRQALDYLLSLSPLDPNPCLIILDINMPRMNGKDTLLRIRNSHRFATVPVILFSTSSLPQDQDFAAEHQAGYITKPLDVRQMEVIATAFIDHCHEDVRKKLKKKI